MTEAQNKKVEQTARAAFFLAPVRGVWFTPSFTCRSRVAAHFNRSAKIGTLALSAEAAYASIMSTVSEIENAVRKLSRQELLAFRDWFSKFDAAAWDRQFEEDVAAGRLDALAEEAIQDFHEGRCREL